MEEQLYNSMVAEYSVGISNQEDFIPSEHVEGIVEVLEGKVESEIAAEDIEIQSNSDGSYEIQVSGYTDDELANEGTLNYSPDNQRCVTHSNEPIDGIPPEGPTQDGKGNDIFGIR